MSVEANDLTSEVWTRWQGHVINGAFPLGRYLGCSDHSGVFLTRSAERPAEVVIKLVPTNRTLAEAQLPRWKRAGALTHRHLLRLLEWGGCQLDGLPYLYTVMEYADQTLAQLLSRRALTDDEAREMLSPILDALAFLHSRNLVQGQLKPTNILVVGDQLKLASDTIRRVSESPMSTAAHTVYDPPEARQGASSTQADIWALGVTLSEALTRRQPSGLGDPGEPVLPADFSPAFRDLVTRCVNSTPQRRPSATQLAAWSEGRSPELSSTLELPALTLAEPTAPEQTRPESSNSPEPAPSQPATRQPTLPAVGIPEPATAARIPPAATPPLTPKPERPAASVAPRPQPRTLLTLILGTLGIIALGWVVLRVASSHRTPATPPTPAQTPAALAPKAPGSAAPAAAPVLSATTASRSTVATSPSPLREVMPDVPQSARRTIHGHLKVWVRVIVDQDGSVFAAAPDRAGPSRYFERLAVDAAKKWTFAPVDAPPRRVVQVRFDFSREGISGHAVALPGR